MIVPLHIQMYQYSDAQSLIDHLLGTRQSTLSEQRLWGYVRVLQEALEAGDIKRVFHISGLWNPVDPLTKRVDTAILLELLASGVLWAGPGRYGSGAARKEADRAQRRARESLEVSNLD